MKGGAADCRGCLIPQTPAWAPGEAAMRRAVWFLGHLRPLQEESLDHQKEGKEFTHLASHSVSIWALGIGDGVRDQFGI